MPLASRRPGARQIAEVAPEVVIREVQPMGARLPLRSS